MFRVIFGFFLLLFSVFSSSVEVSAKMSSFEKELRKTLEENPEIILNILKEYNQDVLKIVVDASEEDTQSALQQYRALWESERTKKAQAIVEKGRPFWGNEKARVVIVAYSDFLCPYCAVSATYVKKFLSKNENVRYIFKNFSKNSLSKKAYGYLLAIWEQDRAKARQFAEIIFNSMEVFAKEKEAFLDKTVKALGLNAENIKKKSTSFSMLLEEDLKEGQKFAIKGTPTLIVNGKYSVVGAVPEEVLEEATKFAIENK